MRHYHRSLSPSTRTLTAAVMLLVCGFLYYSITRSPDVNYYAPVPDYFLWGLWLPRGTLHYAIPSLLHTCAFSLLTLSAIHKTKHRHILPVVMLWGALNIILEFMQATRYLPGTFDPFDLAAVTAGAALAYVIASFSYADRGRRPGE